MDTRRVVLPIIAAALLLAGCTQPTDTLRPLVAPKPTEGIVIYVAGDVEALTGTSSVAVEPGDRVGAGTTIVTKADSSCELQFGGTVSVRVEPDTQFRCGSVAIGGKTAAVSGTLTAGAILAKVKKLTGSDLQVQTSTAVIGVRGTAFKVSVSGDITTVTVREGTVSVTRDGTTVDVGEGQRAEAAPGAGMTPEPARAEDLEAIDAFEQLSVDTSDVLKLVKVVVEVQQPNGSIIRKGVRVGLRNWGALLDQVSERMIVIRVEGYADEPVFLPNEGGKTARIRPTLKRSSAPATASESPGTGTPSTPEPAAPHGGPQQPEAAQPGAAPVVPEPGAIAEQPREPQPAAGLNLAFRVDPAIGDDPFFREMAAQFANEVPRFSLVTGPGSANLPAAAWPRGADLVGGMDSKTQFTYERLPQLVAAGLVRPLEGWFEWTQLAPVLVDAVRVGGKVYGVPIGGSTPVLYYNKDFLRKAPRAWTDIRALMAEYAKRGADPLAMASLEPFFMGMFPESRDIPLLAPDTTRTALGLPGAAAVYDAMREAFEGSTLAIGLEMETATSWFRDHRAAMLIDGPWSFGSLRVALGDSLGVAVLPSWGSPRVELTPYANVLAVFVSSGVSDERALVLMRFFAFLLEKESQLRLAAIRLAAGYPIAPARRFVGNDAARLEDRQEVVSVLYRQLETARLMPRGPLAGDAWRVYREVLEGMQRQEGGEMLAQMAKARFLLYGLERRHMPAGGRELRAVIDSPEKSQGLFFRPWDDESDLRLVEAGGSRGVISVNNRGLRTEGGGRSFLYLILNHDPYRAGRAPDLKGRIEYYDEPNASLRIVYDSKDESVREDPSLPASSGAWKEAALVPCTGTRTWKTAEFTIPDARFDRRCNGADLRIEVMAKGKIPVVRSVILTPVK